MSNEFSAFPVATAANVHAHGMTLRDYFAAKALAFMASQRGAPSSADDPAVAYLAKGAYAMADAMLKARQS